ncbi:MULTISPECIES: RrF2 family transcriptional regulator [Calothrix]|uniref:Rrf2 family transcriptional regulator n=2 Tax=Calothrix TaxID=1186 RepID=A0ABR8A550_9CYAN|nr:MULTISPECIES: Rrf2 family transcriptional regulator [Calothrix]MBD2194923.1 Rrf2 family transcriptional regulator [Calothrix parietina FACHB-288]MBD2223521.1 Rrf2 family transcriptional regulator [Calothrix anomala FACHB-343]
MEISNKSEYALLALLELASRYSSGESLQIRQMAVLQDIPNRYLEQLLATLRRGGLIKSIRGAKGGYVLAREPRKITLLEAWSCIEGVDAITPKIEQHGKTLETQIIQEVWQEARQAANAVLESYTLQDLCDRRSKHREKELMYYI